MEAKGDDVVYLENKDFNIHGLTLQLKPEITVLCRLSGLDFLRS